LFFYVQAYGQAEGVQVYGAEDVRGRSDRRLEKMKHL